MIYNKEIEKYGYKILDEVEVIKITDKFNCEDSLKYKYYIPYRTIKLNTIPLPFHPSNPYSLYNVHNWLRINNPNIECLSDAYINSLIDMNWRCNVCNNKFSKKWTKILSGESCPICSLKKRSKDRMISQSDIIDSFIKIHNNYYDYSKVEYTGIKNKIKVICSIHGEFEILPKTHRNGSGCKLCAWEHISKTQTYTTEQAIEKFKKIHGNKYDYSLVNYIDSKTKIQVVCNLHGIFNITPANHINNKGCKLCGNILGGQKQTLSQDEIIKKFVAIHGNEYDYSLVEYKNSTTKIKVICKLHGEFMITPSSHLNKSGCKLCAINNRGWTKTKWIQSSLRSKKFDSFKVYVLKCWNESELFYKIGRTFQSISQRFHGNGDIPYNYEVLQIIENENGDYIYDLENHLHRLHYKNQLKYLPLINFGGMFECFKKILDIDKILLDFDNTLCNK